MWPVWAEWHAFGHPVLRVTGYGVFAALGAIVGTLICVQRARHGNFPASDAFSACALGLAFGIIGAKLMFLAVSMDRVAELGLMPFLTQGGLVWYGGVLGGSAAVLVFLRAYRLDVGHFADVAAPALAVGHAFGRVGCFMVGCCYGKATALPWGVKFPATDFFEGPLGVALHPVQLYESAAELLLAVALVALGGKVRKGGVFGAWLGGYGALRMAMELLFRGDDRGAGLLGAPPSLGLSVLAIAAGASMLAWPRAGLTTEKIVS